MTLEDRFTRGVVAGLTGGVAHLSVTLTAYARGWSHSRWLDYASVILYGRRPKALSEALAGEATVLAWSAMLGVGYAYATPLLGPRNHRLKGVAFGLATWFGVYGVTRACDFPGFKRVGFGTASSHALGAVIWGLATAETLRRLERRTARIPARDADSDAYTALHEYRNARELWRGADR